MSYRISSFVSGGRRLAAELAVLPALLLDGVAARYGGAALLEGLDPGPDLGQRVHR